MTLDQFVSKYLGRKVDYDGAYAGQCVDLFRQYIKDVHNFPQPKPISGATDFWQNYDSDQNLHSYYDKIPNTPTGVPQKGDIMFWNRRAGGGFGHVSIFLEGDVNGFTSLDQNWPTLSKVTKTKHDYTNVLGWLRVKNSQNSGTKPDMTEQQKKDLESMQNLREFRGTWYESQDVIRDWRELEQKQRDGGDTIKKLKLEHDSALKVAHANHREELASKESECQSKIEKNDILNAEKVEQLKIDHKSEVDGLKKTIKEKVKVEIIYVEPRNSKLLWLHNILMGIDEGLRKSK